MEKSMPSNSGNPAPAAVDFSSKKANPDFPGVLDVVAEEVAKKQTQVLLIDVRRPEEFVGELGHIPGARLMVLDTLPERIQELPKDQTIVFICRSGGRSARATAFARSLGFENVFNMKDGMLRWNELELKVEFDPEVPVKNN
jgi:rhodanese-related sulfurtransferase